MFKHCCFFFNISTGGQDLQFWKRLTTLDLCHLCHCCIPQRDISNHQLKSHSFFCPSCRQKRFHYLVKSFSFILVMFLFPSFIFIFKYFLEGSQVIHNDCKYPKLILKPVKTWSWFILNNFHNYSCKEMKINLYHEQFEETTSTAIMLWFLFLGLFAEHALGTYFPRGEGPSFVLLVVGGEAFLGQSVQESC